MAVFAALLLRFKSGIGARHFVRVLVLPSLQFGLGHVFRLLHTMQRYTLYLSVCGGGTYGELLVDLVISLLNSFPVFLHPPQPIVTHLLL